MKVVSFKVDDSIYDALKKKNMTFRTLFEPLAIQLAQNNRRQLKYTDGIRKNFDGLYQDIILILKKYESEGKK